MEQRNLIHLHPSLSYLGRCLSLVSRNSTNIIIHGASIHKKDNINFLSWLNKYIISDKSNKKLLIKNFKFKKRMLFSILLNIFSLRISKINQSFAKDIILDSICRRKSGILYYEYPLLRKIIKIFFGFYLRILTGYFKSIIDIVKPQNILISHPVYIEYGSLLIASTESKINVIVISGAFHTSYFIKNKFKTYHSTMFLKHIYKKYKFKKKKYINGEAKNSIVNDRKITIKRPSKSYFADTLIISIHCFSDNNHVSDSKLMLFETYYEWFKETCKLLNKIKEPTYKNYVIKIHPYVKVYKDEELVFKTIKKYLINKNINIIICKGNESISDVLNQREISLINVTVHGQICAELGTKGIPTIACGLAQGPTEAQFNPKNIEEYEKIIFNNKFATKCLNKLPSSTKIKNESILYQEFSRFLFPKKSLKEKLYKIREYYNFKNFKAPDKNVFKTLLELKNQNQPKELILKNGWGVFLSNEK